MHAILCDTPTDTTVVIVAETDIRASTIIISSSNTDVLMTPVALRAGTQLYFAAGELDGARSSAYPTSTHSPQSATIGNNKRYDD